MVNFSNRIHLPPVSTFPQALYTTDMVNAPVLREAGLFYAENNLPEISQQGDFQDIMLRTSDLAKVTSYQARE